MSLAQEILESVSESYGDALLRRKLLTGSASAKGSSSSTTNMPLLKFQSFLDVTEEPSAKNAGLEEPGLAFVLEVGKGVLHTTRADSGHIRILDGLGVLTADTDEDDHKALFEGHKLLLGYTYYNCLLDPAAKAKSVGLGLGLLLGKEPFDVFSVYWFKSVGELKPLATVVADRLALKGITCKVALYQN